MKLRNTVNGVVVSTVGPLPYIGWETMVFAAGANGEPDSYSELDVQRYCRKGDAEEGHRAMVAKYAEVSNG